MSVELADSLDGPTTKKVTTMAILLEQTPAAGYRTTQSDHIMLLSKQLSRNIHLIKLKTKKLPLPDVVSVIHHLPVFGDLMEFHLAMTYPNKPMDVPSIEAEEAPASLLSE